VKDLDYHIKDVLIIGMIVQLCSLKELYGYVHNVKIVDSCKNEH